MAEIIPIKGWRYNKELSKDINSLTSPLFDVISNQQREELYKNPFNSIHLSVPQGEDPGSTGRDILEKWKNQGVFYQDPISAIYVYYQYFTLPGDPGEYCRKGFICNIRVYDWEEMVILRHENTIPSSVNDRIDLLAKTEIQVSPTHGLYSDPQFELERYMDESITTPLYSTIDYQGVKDVLGVIHDRIVIKKFIDKIRNKQIILADGHHRYESSLIHKKRSKEKNSQHTGKEGYNFHLMYLTNSESDDIKILPTHRIAQGIEGFEEEKFIRELEKYFYIQPTERNYSRISMSIRGLKWMFGIVLPSYSLLVQLKPDAFSLLEWHFPAEVKELDLTVLHFFIIDKILKIKGKDQRKTEKILYERNLDVCEQKMMAGEAQLIMLTQAVSMDEIKKVCFSGYTLPQKSTYFYPKVVSGFLFNSINDNEFTSSDPCF